MPDDAAEELLKRQKLAKQMEECGGGAGASALTDIAVSSDRADVAGVYRMAADGDVWVKGDMRLYAGAGACGGLWIFGRADEMEQQLGRLRSRTRGSRTPLACGGWQATDGAGGWADMQQPPRLTLAHRVDLLIQPRDLVSPTTGERLSLYNPDLDVQDGGRLVCHVCALTGASKPAAERGRLLSLPEYIRKRSAEVERHRGNLCDIRTDALKAQSFFEKVSKQTADYDSLKEQVTTSVEQAIEYLRAQCEEELLRIDKMRETNQRWAGDKLSELKDLIAELNRRISVADASVADRHPPSFHKQTWDFLRTEQTDPLRMPPLSLEDPWLQKWRAPAETVSGAHWDNHTPQIHNLPLSVLIAPVGATVRIPTEVLDSDAVRTDVSKICVDGVFFDVHLLHPRRGSDGERYVGVFLNTRACDPVRVRMSWSLAVLDPNGDPLADEMHASGVFSSSESAGWRHAIPLHELVESQVPFVVLKLRASNIVNYELHSM
eukprot:TRINITY_DN21676_c0_g1_i1.p1 TRINITY_DN21676_c0_g1~~TRINITY_DN21676_c0_g1_i1.p1  ORF type:complete len:517 (+),score=118.41 TRINITY_DN21676_c0_g1_i1:77-1552(+)